MGQSSLMGQPLKKVPSVPITDANLGVSASSFRISDSLNSNEQLIRNREAPSVFVTHHLYTSVINRYSSFCLFVFSSSLENVDLKTLVEN